MLPLFRPARKDWHPQGSKFETSRDIKAEVRDAIQSGIALRNMLEGKRILPVLRRAA